MIMRSFIYAFLLSIVAITSNASIKKDSSITFFPRARVFPVIFLDPLECQINGGSYFLSPNNSDPRLYSLVNLGFSKPIIANHNKYFAWECNFGAATFTQFDLIKTDRSKYLAGLINNDYKISMDYSLQKNNHTFRLRIFHVSSHLGDDYMLRHNDSITNDKSVNYEQADLTYLKAVANNYYYLSMGEIYTKFVFRKRLSFQGGGLFNFSSSKPINLFTSINLKAFAENNFAPDIRTAVGISFNRSTESMVKIWLEYYNGQLPYSTLDFGRVNWLGLAMWVNFY